MRELTAVVAVLLAVSLPAMAAPGVAADRAQDGDGSHPCVGTMTELPDEETIVSIQGARITSDGYLKKPAMLASYQPDGTFRWAWNASANGRWWAYDVDPVGEDRLLFATTMGGASAIGEIDLSEGDYAWMEHFDGSPDDNADPFVKDAHDADMISEDEMVIADKGTGHQRLIVYNLTRGEITWEWRFEDHPEHFPESGGGSENDWTHVNDVDQVGDDLFMTSVRNFDQVAFVNRSSGDVELTLGEDGNHDVLYRQHNPDHLWGPDDEHTVLVADSLNDRVVEYEYDDASDTWDRVWTVTGLDEPRDADRLPNGNTLVADRKGHRTVEITPEGEVVWEVYTPYEPYDVERGEVDESDGPTMREHGGGGTHELSGQAEFSTSDVEACAAALYEFAPGGGGLSDIVTGGDGPLHTANGSPDEGDGPTIGVGPATGPIVVVLAIVLVTLALVRARLRPGR